MDRLDMYRSTLDDGEEFSADSFCDWQVKMMRAYRRENDMYEWQPIENNAALNIFILNKIKEGNNEKLEY